jgi:hypothetical protein
LAKGWDKQPEKEGRLQARRPNKLAKVLGKWYRKPVNKLERLLKR